VLALKKQIAAGNHVLVKEYIDNGFSGPRFDRPALDEMRKDLKTNVFDVVYFHQADRIAREVVIRTIIIEEGATFSTRRRKLVAQKSRRQARCASWSENIAFADLSAIANASGSPK
jgi:DNA invertase Pin-like site-specific DNA recombinase